MLRGFGKFSLLLGGLSLLVVSCAQGPVNPAGSDGRAMAIPMASGEAVLVDEATKQDLIRSARLHGDFRDAESAINRSGRSLDWEQRVFGYELKGTEGDSTHALIVLLDADTEEGLDDAMVSVYFKEMTSYEVNSVMVTQTLARSTDTIETATADLITGSGTRLVARPGQGQPREFLAGTIAGRGTLEQMATIESFIPPPDSSPTLPPYSYTLKGEVTPLYEPIPPELPTAGDCRDPSDDVCHRVLQIDLAAFQLGWDGYIYAMDTYNSSEIAMGLSALGFALGTVGIWGSCRPTPAALYCITSVAGTTLSGEELIRGQLGLDELAKNTKLARAGLNNVFWQYKKTGAIANAVCSPTHGWKMFCRKEANPTLTGLSRRTR